MQKSVILSSNEIIQKITKNATLMLLRRKSIDKTMFDKINKTNISNTIIKFKGNENMKYSIYIVNSTLNSIVNKSPLDEYLSDNLDERKILIIKNPAKRALKQLYKYENCEFFFVREMLEDFPSKFFIPQHILLNDDEKELLSERLEVKNFSRIRQYDPMVRYYNGKINDVFKIIRMNPTTMEEVAYRIVIKDTIDTMFI
jgi:DNA-directed RNA polymerase subunit H (RpoH/RPB5)